MKHANHSYLTALKVMEEEFKKTNEKLLKELEYQIDAVAIKGEMQLNNVFLSYAIKVGICYYLTELGYQCIENTVGNTFTISWLPSSKK